MLIFWEGALVVLSQPKTGTIALMQALSPRADMVIRQPTFLRHMSYGVFCSKVLPLLSSKAGKPRESFEVISVMRDPVDWVGSWYRYRARSELADPSHPNHHMYSGDVSFDQFVMDVCERQTRQVPPYAELSTPVRVALSADGFLGVDRLFPYEDMSGLYGLLEARTGTPVRTNRINVSPVIELKLSDGPRLALQKLYRDEIELHASLGASGHIEQRFRTTKFATQ